jgi:hypothetical protein
MRGFRVLPRGTCGAADPDGHPREDAVQALAAGSRY